MKNLSHTISPERIIRGENAWIEAKKQIPLICNRPLLLGRSESTSSIRELIKKELSITGINVINENLQYDS